MGHHVDIEIALQLLISFCIGTAIGLEREYRSKAAGFRTMIIICLGSTIFTQLSIFMGGASSSDRIAASIVQGIGFLGAGVIFKDGLSITGITTATTIWIASALGMAVGAGEYFIAIIGSTLVLIVLIVFEKLQGILEGWHQSRSYKIRFENDVEFEIYLEQCMKKYLLHFRKRRDLKDQGLTLVIYEVYGREKQFDELNKFLKAEVRVKSYEY